MSAFFVCNVLPVVTAVVSASFLATAVPSDLPGRSVPTWLASAAVQRCTADGRGADACQHEADGRALVERADALSRETTERRASR